MERQRFGAGCLFGGALVGDEYTNREKRELSFVVSTDHPHRNGNLVHTAGIRYAAFDQNPLLLLSHDAGEKSPKALPLGKWIRRANVLLPDEVPGVIMRGRYLDEETFGSTGETYQLALAVYLMALEGMLNATSIGWLAVDDSPPRRRRGGGLEFEHSELVEVSQALIPANPHALRVEASLGREVLDLGVKRGVLKADQAEHLGRYLGDSAVYDIASIGGDMTGVRVASDWTLLGREVAVAPGNPPEDEKPEDEKPANGEAPADEKPADDKPADDPAPVDPPSDDDEEDEAEELGGEGAAGTPIPATVESRRRDSVNGESAAAVRQKPSAASPLARFVAVAGSVELDTAWARTMASCGALAGQLGALGLIVGADSGAYMEGPVDDGQEAAVRRVQTALNLAEDVVANLSSMVEILAFGPVSGGEGAAPAATPEAVAPVAATPSEADTVAALGKLHGIIKARLTPDKPGEPAPAPEPPAPAPDPAPSEVYAAALASLQDTFRQHFADNDRREKAA